MAHRHVIDYNVYSKVRNSGSSEAKTIMMMVCRRKLEGTITFHHRRRPKLEFMNSNVELRVNDLHKCDGTANTNYTHN
jgi:hypothetical protein